MIEMLVQRGRRGGADDDEEALKVHASFFGGVIIFLCGSNKNTTIRPSLLLFLQVGEARLINLSLLQRRA
jgi:hypothetical protein